MTAKVSRTPTITSLTICQESASNYNPVSDILICDFRKRDLRNQGKNYYPRFNWSTRFHEEAHCLDRKFESGGKDATFPSKGTKGELLLASIQKEALNFINKALDKAGHQQKSTLDECGSAKDEIALLDYLATERIQPESCVNMIDLIGLASHGDIDGDNLADLIKTSKKSKKPLSPHQAKWRTARGHKKAYNKRDYVQLPGTATLGHKDFCDETSEAFAEMTSSRWLGSDCYLTVFDKQNLSGSYGICQDIFFQMTNKDVSGIQW